MTNPNSILIVKLSAIGDVVHALPLLEVLKSNFPKARIDWMVEEEASQIITAHPAIDQVIISRRKLWQDRLFTFAGFRTSVNEAAGLLRSLRSREYDLVIDLQGLLKSGILMGISRGKRKIGMSGAREGSGFFLNESPISVDYDQHAIDRYLKVAEYLGCDGFKWKGHIPVSSSDMKNIDLVLEEGFSAEDSLVAINPIARWDTKLWETKRFAELADRLTRELSIKIIFTGSMNDRVAVEEISKRMDSKSLNLVGRTTLKELAYLYSRCSALVTTDTGPMHIAAAMECPVIALFGPTAPWRTGPYGQKHEVVRADLMCSPCFKKKCQHMTCMDQIRVESVFEAVKKVLNR